MKSAQLVVSIRRQADSAHTECGSTVYLCGEIKHKRQMIIRMLRIYSREMSGE